MLKNKHVIVAMLVAPVLAVLTWFAVGSFVGEQPQAAKPGETYPLVERSNCRYDSGQCDLENEDLALTLTLEEAVAMPTLVLRSSHPLDGVLMAVAAPGTDGQPAAMRARTTGNNEWALLLETVPGRDERLRLVASAGGASWFAETSTQFLERHRGD